MKNIQFNNNNFTCFINGYKSEDIFNDLKKIDNLPKIPLNNANYFNVTHKNVPFSLTIIYKLTSVKIKFIDSRSKTFKGILYFIDDLINVLKELNFENPFYKEDNNYIPLDDISYALIFLKNIKEIKNINKSLSNLDESNLRKIYAETSSRYKNSKKNSEYYLSELNININLFQDKIGLDNEKYFHFKDRHVIINSIEKFVKKKSENNIDNIIYCFYGSYSSGKSTTLLFLNFHWNICSIYLNLKVLKNSFPNYLFWDIIFKDSLYLFIKNQSEDEYFNFISEFYKENKEEKSLFKIILNLLDKIVEKECIVFLDQFSSSIENDIYRKLEVYLKKIATKDNIKIKIIVCSSINDKDLRKIHESYIFEENSSNFFKFDYFPRNEIDQEDIKLSLKDDKLKKILKDKFDNIFLYGQLIEKCTDNITKFINDCKSNIKNKIFEFFQLLNIENNVYEFEIIRSNLNEPLSFDEAKKLSKYIPYKYFNLIKIKEYDNDEPRIKINCYFPLIKEIWEEIIVEKTFIFFSGEISQFEGKIVGTILELNFKYHCLKNKNSLNIDSIIEVQKIVEMNKIISSETNDYNNKVIFFTQAQENAAHYDFSVFDGKNPINKKFCLVQVKKGYTNNKVNQNTVLGDYYAIKNNLSKNFNIKPDKVYLCYIGLINDTIMKKIKNNEKRDKNTKSCLKLYNFCNSNKIKILFFHPIKNYFYKYNELSKDFIQCPLDFFKDNMIISLKFKFDIKDYLKYTIEINENNLVSELEEKRNITINKAVLEKSEIETIMKNLSNDYRIKEIFSPLTSSEVIDQDNKYMLILAFDINTKNYYKAKYIIYMDKYYNCEKKNFYDYPKNINNKILTQSKLYVFIVLNEIKNLNGMNNDI